MDTVTLEQFNYIAEIIASVAVIASLIYVAIQIHQNTHTIKLTSAQNLSHELRDSFAFLISDVELTEIHLRAMQNIESLTPLEKHRLYLWLNNTFRVYENAHYQNTQGTVDKVVWNGIIGNLNATKKQSGYQLFWDERKFFFNTEFQEFYDSQTGMDVNLLDTYQEQVE